MKPNDEERREVARKLRKNAEEHPKMQLILNVAFACDSLRPEGAMDWNVTAHDAAMYLADLVEPAPERTCRAEQDYEAMDDGIPDCRIWKCECGEKFPFWRGLKPIYCPACGAKVIEEESR